MADKDDTSKVPPDRNSDPTRVSAETSPAAGDHKVSNRKPVTRIERAIEAQREQLLQAHGVLTCLYEVLLYAEGDDAINYAGGTRGGEAHQQECGGPGLSADQTDDRRDRVQEGRSSRGFGFELLALSAPTLPSPAPRGRD